MRCGIHNRCFVSSFINGFLLSHSNIHLIFLSSLHQHHCSNVQSKMAYIRFRTSLWSLLLLLSKVFLHSFFMRSAKFILQILSLEWYLTYWVKKRTYNLFYSFSMNRKLKKKWRDKNSIEMCNIERTILCSLCNFSWNSNINISFK